VEKKTKRSLAAEEKRKRKGHRPDPEDEEKLSVSFFISRKVQKKAGSGPTIHKERRKKKVSGRKKKTRLVPGTEERGDRLCPTSNTLSSSARHQKVEKKEQPPRGGKPPTKNCRRPGVKKAYEKDNGRPGFQKRRKGEKKSSDGPIRGGGKGVCRSWPGKEGRATSRAGAVPSEKKKKTAADSHPQKVVACPSRVKPI